MFRTGLRIIHGGVELAVEAINIYRELRANDEWRVGTPFQPYAGPKSRIMRFALGLAMLPVAIPVYVAIGRNKR